MAYSGYTYSIVAGQEINAPLQFAPVAVIVNNYTPYYIYLPDGLTFCPPFTAGVVIPLAHATQARATWSQSPFGTQNVVTIPGVTYTANLTYTEDPNQSLSGGTPVTPPLDTRSTVYTAIPGNTLTTGVLPFTAFGARVDNYTGTWYQIGTTGILVPPFTTGFTLNLLPPVTSLALTPATPPYGTNQNTGTLVVLTVYPIAIGNSSGTTNIPSTIDSYVENNLPAFANVSSSGVLAAFYNLTQAIELKSLLISNPGASACTISVYRLLNDTVNGGGIDIPAKTDPNSPTWVGSVRIAPRIISSSINLNNNIATHTVTLPNNIPVGSQILICFRKTTATATIATPPTGYTLLTNISFGATNGSLALYYKTSVLADNGATVTLVWNVAGIGQAGAVIIGGQNVIPGFVFSTAVFTGVNSTAYSPVTPTGTPNFIISFAGTNGLVAFTSAVPKIDIAQTGTLALGSMYIGYQYTNSLSAVTPPVETMSGVTTGATTAVSLNLTPISSTLSSTLAQLSSIPAGSSSLIDMSGFNIIGRSGAGFAIVSSITEERVAVTETLLLA